MEALIAQHGDRVRVLVTGEIDDATVPEIRNAVSSALAVPDCRLVELSLADVTFIDSSGLGAIVDARLECEVRKRAFALVDTPDRIRRVMELSGLAMLLDSPPIQRVAVASNDEPSRGAERQRGAEAV